MNSTVKVPMSQVMSNITMTVKVTGVRQYTIRLWIAEKLIWLTSVLVGCNIDVKTE